MVVELAVWLKFEVVVNGNAPPADGHVVRQSVVRQIVVAESAVVEAYGNVEAVVEVAVKYGALVSPVERMVSFAASETPAMNEFAIELVMYEPTIVVEAALLKFE